MKNEIVKYENSLNGYDFSNFRAVDLDLFMLICSKVKERQSEVLRFSFGELKKAVNLTRKTDREFLKKLNRMAAEVKKLGGSHTEENEQFFEFNLFGDFYGTIIDVTANNENTRTAFLMYGEVPKNTLIVSVNPRYAFLLNEMKKYTKFDLIEFIQLESKYSKNLYRLLKQYRSTGKYRVEAELFRTQMGCPKSYPNKEFMRVCVNVAVKELSRGYFDNLTVTPIHGAGRGKPIVSYEFTFKKSKEIAGQQNLSDYIDQDTQKAEQPKRKGKNTNNRFKNFQQREITPEMIAALEQADRNQ